MNRNTGMIATIATVLFCGCPGLFMCIFGAIAATGNMPYNTTVNDVTNSGTLPASAGFAMLCLSIIFILIPIAVGFFTLRKKPEAVPTPPPSSDEPLPPAS